MLPCQNRHPTRNLHEGNVSSRVAAAEPKASSKAKGLRSGDSPKALVKPPERETPVL